MTATLTRPTSPDDRTMPPPRGFRNWLRRPLWNRFTPLQLVVITLATVGPLIAVGAISSGLLGLISTEAMIDLALAAGENPGTITFGAMFLASPVQWLTGRSQVRVRKYLGIVFFLLALSNGAMFVVESGITAAFGAPFLIAGSIAVVLAAPLFLTSSRWSQRVMGMKRWRLLHKLTYLVAAAVLGHVLLIGEVDLGSILIVLGFIARVPLIRRWISRRDRSSHANAAPVRWPHT